jgi:2,3-bisphosphoglycerate-independent phosphoglycerate mutase
MDTTVRDLSTRSPKRIVLLVMDGLGGLPRAPGGMTELETARTAHLDALAAVSECGVHLPIGFGVTPGSAPGHLALFGCNPLEFPIGRGVRADGTVKFGERACARGIRGTIPGQALLRIALSYTGKIRKYGA